MDDARSPDRRLVSVLDVFCVSGSLPSAAEECGALEKFGEVLYLPGGHRVAATNCTPPNAKRQSVLSTSKNA